MSDPKTPSKPKKKKKPKSLWRFRAEYFAFRAIVCVIDMLPFRTSVRAAEGLAWFVFRVLPKKMTRYHVAAENIRTAFGESVPDAEVDRIIQGMWTHLFRMVVEIVQIPRKFRLHNCAEFLNFRNRDETIKAMCSGRPVMVLSGHYGNWEMAISTFGVFGFPMGVVARDLDNPYLHEWFRKWRMRTGHQLLSKKGGGTDMVQYMEQRGNLGLLADQDAGKKGLFVPFFGKPASTFKSVALLALQYRAVLLVGYARRLPDDFLNRRWVKFELGTEEVIDSADFDGPNAVRELTEAYTAALERAVRLAPEQYFWVHRRWKSEPRVRKQIQKQAA